MDFIKKNIFSIVFGVIALAAVGALFWPIGGLYAGLQTLLDARMQVNGTLERLANQSRSMPLLSPDETTPTPLEVFPTDAVIAAGTDANAQVHQQAQHLSDQATIANKHDLLLPGELPTPSDQDRFNFAYKYSQEIDGYSRWQKILDSTSPPTSAEVDAAKGKLQLEINKQRLNYDAGGNPTPDSEAEAAEQFAVESADVQPQMELERAQQHRIYLLVPPIANSLPVDPTIKVGSEPAPDKICDAQIVVWMLDDVANAIRAANDHYSDPATPGGPPQYDILHSAVKQIEGIDPPTPVLSSAGFDAAAGVTTPVAKVPLVSPTGRVCNGLYDVLRFKIRLVVDAAKLTQVVRELEAGQFITVLNVQIREVVDPVMAASGQQGGFRYGNKPVIRVEIDCEELLLRSWTNSILPDSKKNGLGRGVLGTSTDNGGQPTYPGGGPSGPYGPGGPGGPGGPYPPGPYGPPGGYHPRN
ncbi:MAG: hypothetical protein ABSD28_05820 [Tepidisphaeraceae bacterium]|jgi:hypothetical protein